MNVCIHLFIFTAAKAWTDTTSTDQSEMASEAPSTPVSDPVQLRTHGQGKKHHFIPKTVRLETGYNPVFTYSLNKRGASLVKVIKSEFCVACGRRTKFGKMCLRCQDCRAVTHPECRDRCPVPCNPITISTPMKTTDVLVYILPFLYTLSFRY